MKYIIAALGALALALAWLCAELREDKAALRADLLRARAVNEENLSTIDMLKRGLETSDAILTEWSRDRVTLDGLRGNVRQAIKEAMRDENFKNWAAAPAPADAWGLLRKAPGPDGNGFAGSAGRPDAKLPGNSHSGGGR